MSLLPARMHTTQSQYRHNTIRPTPLYRSKVAPSLPPFFGGYSPPYPRQFRGRHAPVPPPRKSLFAAGGFRNCSLAVALYRLFILLLVACSLLPTLRAGLVGSVWLAVRWLRQTHTHVRSGTKVPSPTCLLLACALRR